MNFYVFAAALVVIVLAFLLPPLLKKRQLSGGEARHREANLSVLSNQLVELEQEKIKGLLSEANFEQAKAELQRRVLDEVSSPLPNPTQQNQHPNRLLAVSLLVLIPTLAATGYWLLGTPKALDPMASLRASDITPDQIEQMVAKLAVRMEANPEDTQGWVMLAKSYKALKRPKEAVDVYGRIETAISSSPDQLIDYADALAMLAGGNLSGKPIELVLKALRLDPDNLFGLWLAGTAAFDKRDFPEAIMYWEHALAILPPESDERQTLSESLAEAKRLAGAKTNPTRSVAGQVDLAPELKFRAGANDTLFIFARAIEGSRFPLAITKIKAADLPYSFILDDSMAMMSDKQISTQSQVIVEARISKTGNASPQNGDLQSKPVLVKVGEKSLRLHINQVVER